MSLLQFSSPEPDRLRSLNDSDWAKFLRLCDETQITLITGELAKQHLPSPISERLRRNLRDNTTRFSRLSEELSQISEALDERAIEYVILKGVTHAPSLTGDPLLRAQGDIDLWCRGQSVFEARRSLIDLGYRSIGKSKGRHLDPLIRETSWEWTGDYFAPDLPIPVDLHFKLWDEAMEHIPGPREADVWERRCPIALAGGRLAYQLCLADTVMFAALHLLMHLLHGDLRLQRAWEIGYFLEHHTDPQFWRDWRNLYSEDVRRLQMLIFVLGSEWFGCSLPEAIQEEAQTLPADIRLWIENYAWSPVESLFKTNKDELWLNLALLSSSRDKARVFIRRLLPIGAVELRSSSGEAASHRNGIGRRAASLVRRTVHHLTVVPQICWGMLAWWWKCRRVGAHST